MWFVAIKLAYLEIESRVEYQFIIELRMRLFLVQWLQKSALDEEHERWCKLKQPVPLLIYFTLAPRFAAK